MANNLIFFCHFLRKKILLSFSQYQKIKLLIKKNRHSIRLKIVGLIALTSFLDQLGERSSGQDKHNFVLAYNFISIQLYQEKNFQEKHTKSYSVSRFAWF